MLFLFYVMYCLKQISNTLNFNIIFNFVFTESLCLVLKINNFQKRRQPLMVIAKSRISIDVILQDYSI